MGVIMEIILAGFAILVAFAALYVSSQSTDKLDQRVRMSLDGHVIGMAQALDEHTHDIQKLSRRLEASETTRMEQTGFVNEIKREMKAYDDKIAALRREMETAEARWRGAGRSEAKHLA